MTPPSRPPMVTASPALAALMELSPRGSAGPPRARVRLAKGEALYCPDTDARVLFVIIRGLVKVGTVTADGHELIYDIRGEGELVGELCASRRPRRDRAVAIEPTDAVSLSVEDLLDVIGHDRTALRHFVGLVSDSLSDAYEQLHTMAFRTVLHRLVKMLLRLADRVGRPTREGVEIGAYMTQEELAQMVGVRRERLSTAMNFLRRRGMVAYSRRGLIVLDLGALESFGGVCPAL